MDIVYVVGPGDRNDELRYSLRSLVNLPHDQVWIAGHKPSWVRGVEYVPVPRGRTKWQSSTANLRAACQNAGVSDRFVYFNDDFHIIEPIAEVPTLHRGPLDDVLARYRYTTSRYVKGMRVLRDYYRTAGVEDPLSYELHAPMVLVKARMLETLDTAADISRRFPLGFAVQKRTMYGNQWEVGGTQVPDVKVSAGTMTAMPPGPFVSTTLGSFNGACGRRLRAMFPHPSSYER